MFNIIPHPTIPSNASESLSPSPASTTATQFDIPVDPNFQPENLIAMLPIPLVSLHLMPTRSKSGIIKKRAFSASVISPKTSIVEPTTYKATSTIPEWHATMQDEISALHTQQTWDLIPLSSGKNLVRCKWMYKVKKNLDGSISRYKA